MTWKKVVDFQKIQKGGVLIDTVIRILKKLEATKELKKQRK
jgi:hypothetical protein